jgi:signal transduction histidine kinase
MEFRRDLYLAYKELLRNIVRHAKATQVDIGIVIKRDVVQLSIRDNGKGFDVNEPTQRSGIMNIKERARRWRGHAEWQSAPGMGSRVSLVMKQK